MPVAAVKRLLVFHHSAGFILFFLFFLFLFYLFFFFSCFLWNHWVHSGYFENWIPIKPVLGGRMQLRKLHSCILDKTESPIFIPMCVLCFQMKPFRLFFNSVLTKDAKGSKEYCKGGIRQVFFLCISSLNRITDCSNFRTFTIFWVKMDLMLLFVSFLICFLFILLLQYYWS